MTDLFYILPLMVLGFCDAFDKLPNYSNALIDLPKWASAKGVHPRAIKPLMKSWHEDDPNNSDNSHRYRRSVESSGSASEAHSNSKRPHKSIKHSSAFKPSDYGGSLPNRRHFLEPIFDGNIIGSVGKLFSDNIKEEADRERVEREKIRAEELLKKYTGMLNDPKQLAELQREAANSPNFINQTIRRSLSPSFNEPIQSNVDSESSRRHRFNFDESGRNQGNNHHQRVTSDNSGESDERTSFSSDDLSLASLFNDIDKERRNLQTDRDSDEAISIETFPLDINSVRSRLRPSIINLNRNRYQLWKYPTHVTVNILLGRKDV